VDLAFYLYPDGHGVIYNLTERGTLATRTNKNLSRPFADPQGALGVLAAILGRIAPGSIGQLAKGTSAGPSAEGVVRTLVSKTEGDEEALLERVDEFINLFNRLADHLEKIVGGFKKNARWNFLDFVDGAAQKNSVVNGVADELKDYGRLRNLITHSVRVRHMIIAAPTQAGLSRFRQIVQDIMHPKRLIPTFQKEVRCFSMLDPLVTALKYMAEGDFSQAVVRKEGRLHLLTAEGIGRWLERHANEGTVAGAAIKDTLRYEVPNNFMTMGQDCSVHEARQAFQIALNQRRPRLFAIIITSKGGPTEDPLGIATPWDLLGDAET